MTSDFVRRAVDRALCPGSFFVAPPANLRIEHVAGETVRWEVFRGHLLDPAHARQNKRFSSWHVFLDSPPATAEAPLLTVRQASDQDAIYVTRQIYSEAYEAYDESPGVIVTRPVRKWVAELVGTIERPKIDTDALAAELGQLLFLAVIGTSRLPITSLESPLPDFSLGGFAYLPMLADNKEPWSDAVAFAAAALAGQRPLAEQAKAVEVALRAVGGDPLQSLGETLGRKRAAELLRAVFNGAALSPYTNFVDALVGGVVRLADAPWFGPAEALDALGYMLRHLCRHLTAFDLTVFHNFGANYPDALFLDALLQAYLKLGARHSELLRDAGPPGRRRRSALRQACLMRKHYEGHRVPDAPTSMGENLRVLPAPFVRVPQEQILDLALRKRRLFAGLPTGELLGEFGHGELAAAIADLDEPIELRELGMALFLDRPLGVLKEPGEVDRTPLLAYEAFSRSIAKRRLRDLAAAGWMDEKRRDALIAAVDKLVVSAVPLRDLSVVERPGVVSIADAAKAATDFAFLRTTRATLDTLLGCLDLHALAGESPADYDWLVRDKHVLLVQHVPRQSGGRARLHAYDRGRFRLELELPPIAAARS
jgi:hypothetical protein